MEMTKTVYINSYYSDVDFRDTDCTDGIYKIACPRDMDLKKEIENAYESLSDEGEDTNTLSCMLDYLKDNGVQIEYETIEKIDFDCDYGKFD